MVIKNIIRIIKVYKFSLIKVVFYELLYLIKGYKGNNFKLLNHNLMNDNIPCPYYFLNKIDKFFKNNNFQTFVDLGCGSGRVINFFNRRFKNKNFIGIDFFAEQINYCKKIFLNYNNIKLIQADIVKTDFLKYDVDCYFLNEPINNDIIFIELIKKIVDTQLLNKKIFFIFVNCNLSLIKSLKNIELIENYYITKNRGYCICTININK